MKTFLAFILVIFATTTFGQNNTNNNRTLRDLENRFTLTVPTDIFDKLPIITDDIEVTTTTETNAIIEPATGINTAVVNEQALLPELPAIPPALTQHRQQEIEKLVFSIQTIGWNGIGPITSTAFIYDWETIKKKKKRIEAITAAHCVCETLDKETKVCKKYRKQILLSNKIGGKEHFIVTKVVQILPQADIALLEGEGDLSYDPPKDLRFSNPIDGHQVVSLGYPWGDKKASVGIVETAKYRTFAMLRLFKHYSFLRDAKEATKLTIQTEHGNPGISGSPGMDVLTGDIVVMNISHTNFVHGVKGLLLSKTIEMHKQGFKADSIQVALGDTSLHKPGIRFEQTTEQEIVRFRTKKELEEYEKRTKLEK